MEHVLNFDEFMKDKCGGGIKENIMCMKVWEKLVKEMKVVNCAWRVNKKKRDTWKKNERKEKWKERKIQKQRMCMMWKKIEA